MTKKCAGTRAGIKLSTSLAEALNGTSPEAIKASSKFETLMDEYEVDMEIGSQQSMFKYSCSDCTEQVYALVSHLENGGGARFSLPGGCLSVEEVE